MHSPKHDAATLENAAVLFRTDRSDKSAEHLWLEANICLTEGVISPEQVYAYFLEIDETGYFERAY